MVLYLTPSDNAIVLSFDEKTQIQALERTQPLLPVRPGLPARQTHDYRRAGVVSLYAALEVASGKVSAACRPRHTGADFLGIPQVACPSLSTQTAAHQPRQLLDPLHSSGQGVAHQAPRIALHFTLKVLLGST